MIINHDIIAFAYIDLSKIPTVTQIYRIKICHGKIISLPNLRNVKHYKFEMDGKPLWVSWLLKYALEKGNIWMKPVSKSREPVGMVVVARSKGLFWGGVLQRGEKRMEKFLSGC